MQEPRELWVGVGGGAFGAFGLFHTFICMQPFFTKRSFKCLGIYLHNTSQYRRKAKDFGRINGEAELLKSLLI